MKESVCLIGQNVNWGTNRIMYSEIVVAGIILAVIYYEITQLSPGGLVTPAYMALCLMSPVRIIYTAVIVVVSWLILHLVSRFWIIYGKRRFTLAVLLTFMLDFIIGEIGIFPFGIQAIGYVVPAMIVRDVDKQGAVKTGLSIGIVTGVLALFMLWFGAV